MKRYTVRVRVPLTMTIHADSEDAAVREAVRLAPSASTPEDMTDAFDLLKSDGNSYPHDFAEVFDSEYVRDEYGTRPVRFCFADDKEFDGFTDDSYWNGFLNVEVNPEVLAEINSYFNSVEPESVSQFNEIEPHPKSGRYDLSNGFATEEA